MSEQQEAPAAVTQKTEGAPAPAATVEAMSRDEVIANARTAHNALMADAAPRVAATAAPKAANSDQRSAATAQLYAAAAGAADRATQFYALAAACMSGDYKGQVMQQGQARG